MAVESVAAPLSQIVILLGAAVLAVPLFRRLGLDSVLAYLCAGVLIGPFGLGFFTHPEGIVHIAELGVVMFLFVIGLEMHASHLWSLRHQIFGLGAAQVLSAMFLLTVLAVLFGFSWPVAFVCAAGFVLTSTAIVMQVLGERRALNSVAGQRMVSILLFEDLLIVPLLAVVAFLAPVKDSASEGSVFWSLVLALGSLVLLLFLGRFVLNPLFNILARSKAREVMTAAALLVVLGAALLMEAGGLSMAMGAFVAGVLLSESVYRHQLEADIEPFRGLLLGLFFLGVGMSLNIEVVLKNWQFILLLMFVFMLMKALCIFGVAKLFRHSNQQASERAVMMAQGGEFAFVLFSAASVQGVISSEVHANMTAVVVLSMVFTPLLLIVYRRFEGRIFAERQNRDFDTIETPAKVVLIGAGRFGQIVSDLLVMTGYKPTIIDKNATMVNGLGTFGIKAYYGDGTHLQLLQTAGLSEANLLVVAIDDKEQTLQIVKLARSLNPNLQIIARAFDRIHAYRLRALDVHVVVRETFDSALRTGRSALKVLGMDEKKADKISALYFRRDRHSVFKMADLYDEKYGLFQNRKLIAYNDEYDQQTQKMIEAILNNEEVIWENYDEIGNDSENPEPNIFSARKDAVDGK